MNIDNYKKTLFYSLVALLMFMSGLSIENTFEYVSHFLKFISFGMCFAALYYNLKIEE